MPHKVSARRVALALLLALAVEAGLVGLFTRIPKARTLVPLRIVDSAAAYDWTPADAPRWFHTDDPTIAQASYFRQAISPEVDADATTFEQELAIMNWVRQQVVVAHATQAIPGDPISVHTAMLAGTPAQCGNFATLFAASSASLGLTETRYWFMLSYDGPNGQGHTINEVWVPELDKWVMLDPMNNAYVLLDGEPASLLEVREAVLTGQRERLEPVVGPNAHTAREDVLDLYELTMIIVSLEAAHTPLTNYYRQTWGDWIVARLPDVVNLPFLADRAFALLSGEVRQVTLIDDLARERMLRLPIWQAKTAFAAMVVGGGVVMGLALWLALLGLHRLRVRLAAFWRATRQPD